MIPKYSDTASSNVLFYSLPEIVYVEDDFVLEPEDSVSYAEDGTVVYLYFNLGEWMTATKNKIDAKMSKFSSEKSFDELFWEVFDKTIIDTLDKDCTYIFVLRHLENRIVIKHDENELIFLNKVNNLSGKVENAEASLDNLIREQVLDTRDLISKYEHRSKFRGILVKRKESYYMYDFDEYTSCKKIRGNTPDVLYRYIVFLNNYKKLFKLVGMYPEESVRIGKLNKKMYDTCIDIHNNYRCGKSVKFGHDYYNVIKTLHKKHGRLAELDDVFPIFYKQNPSFLYKMLIV